MTTAQIKTPTRLDAEAVLATMADAWNAVDTAAIGACYTVDGRLFDPLGHEWDGRDAIVAAFDDYFRGLLAGSTTEITVESHRELAPGLAIVDGHQTFTGGLPTMHITAVIRTDNDAARVVECRPYAWLDLPNTDGPDSPPS